MTKRTDDAYVRKITLALDGLYEICKAANEAGLSITLTASEDDDEKVARVDAYITRRWRA